MTRSRKQRRERKQRIKQQAAAGRQHDPQFPICPECGERHPPDTAWEHQEDPNAHSRRPDVVIPSWVEPDGVHTMLPADLYEGPEMLEEMSKDFQRRIRQSPLWDQMVEHYGQEKAEELLSQCRAELR